MDKQQEIKVLQSLKGDTYFNQFFSVQDIDRMCNNISNDFSIACNCDFHRKALTLQQQAIEKEAEYEYKNEVLAQSLIDTLCESIGEIPDCIHDILYKMAGKLSVIKYKRLKNYEFTEDELDYLIQAAELL